MPIEPVKIPQNVYVEDRIVGPVTLRQLIITGVGGGISYIIFSILTKAGFTGITIKVMCGIPALIAAMFAFLKINDLSMLRIILLFVEGMNKPRQRVWSPACAGLSINLITRETVPQSDPAQAKAVSTAARLAEMTEQLQSKQRQLGQIVADEHVLDDMSATEAEHIVVTEKRKTPPEDVEIASPSVEQQTHTALPVQPDRIGVSGLDPSRSIDAIMGGEIPALLGSAVFPD
jgi:hypothetical protein